jgi:thiol-disulfide isomerase/thioredoxin
LTDDNFEQTINKGKPVMLKFYAPWDGHQRVMQPEYITLAEQVKKNNKNVVIAQLDYTVNENTSRKYNVDVSPLLQSFVKSLSITYRGTRKSDDMLKFIREYSKVVSIELKSQKEIHKNTRIEGVRCLLVSDDPEDLKNYKNAARKQKRVHFFHTSEELGKTVFPEITKKLQVRKIIYEGPIESQKLADYLQANQENVLTYFDALGMTEIFHDKRKKAVMLIYDNKIDGDIESSCYFKES